MTSPCKTDIQGVVVDQNKRLRYEQMTQLPNHSRLLRKHHKLNPQKSSQKSHFQFKAGRNNFNEMQIQSNDVAHRFLNCELRRPCASFKDWFPLDVDLLNRGTKNFSRYACNLRLMKTAFLFPRTSRDYLSLY